MSWPPSPTVILGYIAVVATVAAIVSGIMSVTVAENNRDRIEDIEQAAVDACLHRNELRTVLRVQTQREIDKSLVQEASGVYEDFFPDADPQRLHDLLEEERGDLRDDKARLANEVC
jgi:hypothetical protein